MELDKCVIFEEKENIDGLFDSKAYSLVLVVTDMEPFMGVDGYVYEIRSGDIITLPRKNADVLTERNIVLNIKSS
jgi:DNA replication factor GINS